MSKPLPPELNPADIGEFDILVDFIKRTHVQFAEPKKKTAVHNAWLKLQLELADAEGGEYSIEEVFGEIRSELNAMKSAE